MIWASPRAEERIKLIMKIEDKISFRQFAVLIFVGLFSPITRLLPKSVVRDAGISGWITPILAFFPLLGLIWFVRHIMKQAGEGEGLADVIIKMLGKPVGKIVCIIYMLWILLYCGFVLRSGGERLLSTIYPIGNLKFFLALLLIVATVSALGKVRYIARSSEIFFIILLVTLALLYAFALPGINKEYLLPVDVLAVKELTVATLPVINVISTFIYICFLAGHIKKPKQVMKSSVKWLVLVTISMLLMIITTVGILGPGITQDAQFPFFIMTRNISIFNVIERIEALVTIIWVATDYVFVSALLMAASKILETVFGGKREWYTVPSAVVVYAAALLIAPDAFSFFGSVAEIVPIINAVLVFVGLPLMYIFRKRSKKGIDIGG